MPKLLIFAGLVLIAVGVLWLLAERFGLGRLPGDFVFERDNVKIYVPFASSLIVSALVSVIFWLLNR